MKKIGLVGGISWTSTVDYYRLLNTEVNKKAGGLNFAECIIYSVNFNEFSQHNAAHDWEASFALLGHAAQQLKNAGAELVMLGANTAHIVAEKIETAIGIPLIDIRTATANAIKEKNITCVGLLGTVYTMELDFYKEQLARHGIKAIVPDDTAERNYIEETLLHELGKGIITAKTKAEYIRIADQLIDRGAEGIVLGCTEIPLLLSQDDFTVPVFNTTQIHVEAAVKAAFE
ncbi:amino acid racemase [Nostoc ellipsosporum NOK]|nr:amino acid racemase [Nostoc ellipsosporum NOK]